MTSARGAHQPGGAGLAAAGSGDQQSEVRSSRAVRPDRRTFAGWRERIEGDPRRDGPRISPPASRGRARVELGLAEPGARKRCMLADSSGSRPGRPPRTDPACAPDRTGRGARARGHARGRATGRVVSTPMLVLRLQPRPARAPRRAAQFVIHELRLRPARASVAERLRGERPSGLAGDGWRRHSSPASSPRRTKAGRGGTGSRSCGTRSSSSSSRRAASASTGSSRSDELLLRPRPAVAGCRGGKGRRLPVCLLRLTPSVGDLLLATTSASLDAALALAELRPSWKRRRRIPDDAERALNLAARPAPPRSSASRWPPSRAPRRLPGRRA